MVLCLNADCNLCFFSQFLHTNPAVLYECYRNGVSFEPENSLNVTLLLDGTKSPPNNVEITVYSTTADSQGKVSRFVLNSWMVATINKILKFVVWS